MTDNVAPPVVRQADESQVRMWTCFATSARCLA